jgi:hypothetical protein
MAGEIGIILVKTNCLFVRQLLVPAPRTLGQNSFARFVLSYEVVQGGAFRGGIFRMGMIVVEARAIA